MPSKGRFFWLLSLNLAPNIQGLDKSPWEKFSSIKLIGINKWESAGILPQYVEKAYMDNCKSHCLYMWLENCGFRFK